MLRDIGAIFADPAYVGKARSFKDIPPARRDFARRLTAARIDAGFATQKDFAEKLGVEAERYRMWERGDREPDITHFIKISKLLGRPLDWLILGEKTAPLPRRAISG